jgi:hexosaminidase
VNYFYLSTDEPYYVGKSDSALCNEAARQKELGSPGKVLAQFVTKAAGYLHGRGRTVIFWGEYPLKPEDVPALPAYLVNGETVDPKFDAAFKARGIRQMFYTSTQGEEPLFPDYAILPKARRVHAAEDGKPRVTAALETIRSAATRSNADLMGMMVAGWADAGLHPETFWLGYSTIGAAGWNPRDCDPDETAAAFYRLFYGPSAQKMDRVYELMSQQAQSWSDTWETIHSNWRKPIWGNSAEIFHPGHPARDQSIPLPPAPSGQTLAAGAGWDRDNARRMQIVAQSLADNDHLLDLLNRNSRQVQFNRYNLQVFISIARLCRQNLFMLQEIARINQLIATAHQQATQGNAREAVAALDQSLGLVRRMIRERNVVLKAVTDTWYQTWLPRVAEANGRTFLHELDDVKDHLPDRTIGMEYLVYRELHLPIGEWIEKLQSTRNAFASANHLPLSNDLPAWNRLDD